MFRRRAAAGAGSDGAVERTDRSGLPNLSGDLDGLLSTAPCFRLRARGYDRLQVDNYVAWAESELATGRRQLDHLLARYGECSAELELSRRLLAQTPIGVALSLVSDRVRDMLRLAAEEATAMVDAAREEAAHLLSEARLEADTRLRKAHEIKELAADAADEMREQATRHGTEAAAVLARARTEAAELVRDAVGERDRLTDEAAEARERLADVQAEIDDLSRQRDDARASVRRLTDRIGEALAAVTGSPPEQFLLVDNRVESLTS